MCKMSHQTFSVLKGRMDMKQDLCQHQYTLSIILLNFLAQALFMQQVHHFSLNIVFKRTALANILVAVAELLLTAGISPLMNNFKLESMYFKVKIHVTIFKKSSFKLML